MSGTKTPKFNSLKENHSAVSALLGWNGDLYFENSLLFRKPFSFWHGLFPSYLAYHISQRQGRKRREPGIELISPSFRPDDVTETNLLSRPGRKRKGHTGRHPGRSQNIHQLDQWWGMSYKHLPLFGAKLCTTIWPRTFCWETNSFPRTKRKKFFESKAREKNTFSSTEALASLSRRGLGHEEQVAFKTVDLIC